MEGDTQEDGSAIESGESEDEKSRPKRSLSLRIVNQVSVLVYCGLLCV